MKNRWGLGWVLAVLIKVSLACPDPQAVIVSSYPAFPYEEVARYLKESLERRGIPAVLAGSTRTSPCPKLWVALGSEAAAQIRKQDPTTPMLIGLVFHPESIAQFAPATGVFLEHPLPAQWRSFRRLYPRVRQLAVLYDPRFADRLTQLERLAQAEGVLLTRLEVVDVQALDKVLTQIPEEVEALWPIGDGQVFSLLAARPLFLWARRKNLVLVGLSARWVEAGAAYALDWDWPRLAEQLGELGQVLWQGRSVTELPPQPPRDLKLVTRLQLVGQNVSRRLP